MGGTIIHVSVHGRGPSGGFTSAYPPAVRLTSKRQAERKAAEGPPRTRSKAAEAEARKLARKDRKRARKKAEKLAALENANALKPQTATLEHEISSALPCPPAVNDADAAQPQQQPGVALSPTSRPRKAVKAKTKTGTKPKRNDAPKRKHWRIALPTVTDIETWVGPSRSSPPRKKRRRAR